MNLTSTQIKDTYGNLVTIGSVAGTPTTGALQNGAGSTLASLTMTNTTLEGGLVINESGADVDFRVEGLTDTNLLFVDASADRVGIGTATPASLLDVDGDVTLSQASDIKWMNTARDTTYGVIEGLAAGTVFKHGVTETMRITSSGNVGIGVTPVGTRLSVRSDVANTGTVSGTTIQSVASFFPSNDFGSLTIGATGAAGADVYIGSTFTGGDVVMFTRVAPNNNEVLRITDDKYLRMASGSGGIQFGGDTAAANALDDYEEGTFTPVLTGSTSGTYNLIGNYTIIGNVFNFYITLIAGLTNASKPIGDYTITGLPVAAKATSPDYYSFAVLGLGRVTFDGNKIMQARLLDGETTITLEEATSNALATPVTDSNFVNASNMFFRIQGSYLI